MKFEKKIVKNNYGGHIYLKRSEMEELDVVPGDVVIVTIGKKEALQ